MDKDSDLLPWILGGLTMATVALAIAVGSTNRTAPKSVRALSLATAYAVPPAPAKTVPEPAPMPAPIVAATEIQATIPPAAPSNQIWECTTNGQRTFSNHPCGEKSFLREVGPINGMDPTPLYPPTRSYEPPSSYAPEYSYPNTPEAVDNSYPVLAAVPFNGRRRPDHPYRPYRHDHGPSPRRN